MTADPHRRLLQLKVAATLAGVAVMGFAIGMMVRPSPTPNMAWVTTGPEGEETTLQSMPAPHWFDELDLTPLQRAAIDSILAAGNQRLEQSMTPLLAEIRASVAEAHRAVRRVLDSGQVARLDSLLSTLPVFQLRRGGDSGS